MIWLKMLGIALVVAGSGTFGLMGAKSIEDRVEQIKQVRLALAFLQKEITYMQTPLTLALSRTAHFTPPPARLLFAESSQALQDRQGVRIEEAWEKGLKALNRNGHLRQEDLELLRSFSGQLGMSGIEEQKRLFHMIDEELQIQEKKARQELESNKKIWSYGGFILGATVVVLLV